MIFIQQRRIRRLALGPITTDLDEHIRLNAFGPNPCSMLEDLSIPRRMWGLRELEAYKLIMGKASRLSRLSIRTSHFVEFAKQLDNKTMTSAIF